MILLCLLGVTFHLGSRPARPRVETLDDLSGRATHGGTLGQRTSSITAGGTSAPTSSDTPDAQSDNPSAQGQPSGEGGVKSGTDKSPARRSGLTSGVQNSWVIHMSGPQMANAPSPAPRGRVNGPFVTSERSLRSVWKAGPGDHSDPEQVGSNSSIDCVDGGGVESLIRFALTLLNPIDLPHTARLFHEPSRYRGEKHMFRVLSVFAADPSAAIR